MNIQREKFNNELFKELLFLIEEGRKEVYSEIFLGEIIDTNYMKTNVNFSNYEYFEEIGILRVFTLRNEENLVGCFICTISEHSHCKDYINADSDYIFISKDYRNFKTFSDLIKFSEEYMIENDKMSSLSFGLPYKDKVKHNLFKRKGFLEHEVVLKKEYRR